MENNPTETTNAVAVESPQAETTPAEVTQETPAEPTPSTSKEPTEDLTALIETEKKRGDSRRGFDRVKKKREQVEEEPDEPEDDSARPVTRKELEDIIAKERQAAYSTAYADRITELSEELGETPQEAELIRTIHANRVFPADMPLRDQLSEAHAIASYKRMQARNGELARAVLSQQTATRSTATTHRDPQAAAEPTLAPDVQASLKRAGYTFNSMNRRYEKKLPNGKTLVKEGNRPPYTVG